MVSNFDGKCFKNSISEGRRHYNIDKKTSLYGSESPKDNRNRSYKQRYSNPNNIFGASDDEIYKQEYFTNDSKSIASEQDKGYNLDEASYNSRGRSDTDGSNPNYSTYTNQVKSDYEKDMKNREEINNSAQEPFPGFSNNFGAGQVSNNNRRRAEKSQNNDYNENNYFPFGLNGSGASNSTTNNQGATVTIYKNQDQNNLTQKKYEKTKAMADELEKEIQRLKFQQMENKYEILKNNSDDQHSDDRDKLNRSGTTDEDVNDDALSREAENRAMLRELEKLKESYDQDNTRKESNFTNDSENREKTKIFNEDEIVNDYLAPYGQKFQVNSKKVSVTNNRNDYRPYTIEEYMNCRPKMVNPSLNKRTTLSGSEDRKLSYNNIYDSNNNQNSCNNNNNNNYYKNNNLQMIDEDNIIRKFSKSNTHSNLFPTNKMYSPVKADSSYYQTKAPYATD